MSDGRDYKRSKRAWELAGRQHGVVARRQLSALGFNAREIDPLTTFRLSDSALEIAFRALVASAGLPPPLTKQRVNGFEVDFFLPI